MEGCGRTDRGIVRKDNQDYFGLQVLEDGELVVCVVCDGMGGAKAGNVASRLAAETFLQQLTEDIAGLKDEHRVAGLIKTSLRAANHVVHDGSMSHEDYKGMGTTLVGAVVYRNRAHIVNVGDSRAYVVSDTDIIRITRDHSLVEDMITRGDITREEAATHPNRNLITRALGTEALVSGDVYEIAMQEGDRLLLCTDGLTNLVGDEELLQELSYKYDLDKSCEMLIHLALARGGPDNVTALIVSV